MSNTQKNFETLMVGNTYIGAQGHIETIVDEDYLDTRSFHTFAGASGKRYSSFGRCNLESRDFDLVELITLPTKEERRLENVFVQISGRATPTPISQLNKEDYEGFLEAMHQLRTAYISVTTQPTETCGACGGHGSVQGGMLCPYCSGSGTTRPTETP